MSRIASRLTELGLTLSPPLQAPDGIKLPFPFINVRGDRVIISGHGPQNTDGSLAGPFGKVGAEVTMEPTNINLQSTPGPTPIRIAFCKGPDGEIIEFFQNELT